MFLLINVFYAKRGLAYSVSSFLMFRILKN